MVACLLNIGRTPALPNICCFHHYYLLVNDATDTSVFFIYSHTEQFVAET